MGADARSSIGDRSGTARNGHTASPQGSHWAQHPPIKDVGATGDDLTRQGIIVKNGLRLTLFTLDGTEGAEVDDLVCLGEVISYPADGWVATVLPATLRHVSELDPIDRRLYRRALTQA